MNWLNIPIETLTSEAFLGSEPVDRATWLCLMRYCAQHETGGVIHDCGSWGDRKWMQLAGVTKAEVHRTCSLWSWKAATATAEPIAEQIAELSVSFYPLEQERAAQAKREAGRRYGRGKPPKTGADDVPPPAPPPKEGEEKGNGKGNYNAQLIAERIAELSTAHEKVLAYLQSTGKWNHRDIGTAAEYEIGKLVASRGEATVLEEAEWYASHHQERYAPLITGLIDLAKWPKIRAAMDREAGPKMDPETLRQMVGEPQ